MRADLDTMLNGQLAGVPDGKPEQDGVGVGAAAARQIVALRASDGSSAPPAPFTAGTAPGDYRPTPPKLAAPTYTGWGSVAPFLLTSPQQFRPATPPAVSSLEYATALAEVRDLGRDTSTSRTVDQTVAGKFWSASPIWTTWNQVAQQLVTDRHAGPRADHRGVRGNGPVAGRHDHRAVRREVHRPRVASGHRRAAGCDRRQSGHHRRPDVEPADPDRRRPVLPRRAQRAQ